MPYPGPGFPIPPLQWPHVGRQWPAYNVESDQADGLVAWWPTLASREANILQDLTNYGNDCSFPGGAANPTWVVDTEHGWVLSYDGGDHVTAVENGSLDFAINDHITIGLWLNPSGISGPQTMLSKGRTTGSTDANYCLRMSDAKFQFYYRNTGAGWTFWTSTNDLFTASAWHLLSLVHTFGDTGGPIVHVNRALIAGSWTAGAGGDVPVVSDEPLWLGDNQPGTQSFTGLIGDVRIKRGRFVNAGLAQYDNPWELYQLPQRLWRLGVVAPPPVGQPTHLRALHIPHLRQWQPRVAS